MTDIHIPPEALEAGARAIREFYSDAPIAICDGVAYKAARAAFLAMVKAWPNGNLHVPVGAGEPRKSFTLPASSSPCLRRTPMLKPEQVPDEVVEAFVDAFHGKDMTRKAAIAAALNAWPGAVKGYRTDDGTPFIKIPLPTEASDD